MNKLFLVIITIFAALTVFSTDIGIASAAPILKLNSQGHDVEVLQKILQKEHFDITINGIFDETTQKALKTFQENNKLPVTGIVDRQTWSALTGKSSTGSSLSPAVTTPTITKPSVTAPTDNTAAKSPVKLPPPIIIKPTGSKKPPTASNSTTAKKPQSEESALAAIRAQKVVETAPFLPTKNTPALITTAKKYIGVPYVYGGATPKGFDCSGYLQYVFKQNNFTIPRTADEQYKLGKKVPINQLKAGDLVFFATDVTEISHSGIYIGNGEFIHASSSKGVRIDRLDNDYWQKYFISGKHIVK